MTFTSADRAELVRLFRERLITVMTRSGLNQSAFAGRVGIDRSTLSQLLSPTNDRLPRLESVASIARLGQVSLDWLLGLRDAETAEPGLLADALSFERDALSPVDERLMHWLEEAAGYKIRHVPVSFPDVLKTPAVIDFEYERFVTVSPHRRMEITQARLDYLRRPETDMEAATPAHIMESFARGGGRWQGLPVAVRRAQLDHLIALCDELYPRFRWFLYDGRELYSSPITIYGPIRAAIYIGQSFLVMQNRDHVRSLISHFDLLLRAAKVDPRQMPDYLRRLRQICR
ncbi:helix-turn-helix transcriptional regulator [Acidisoma cellulosilytica]|uniref:Helix-turn-helix transcriptional regulator n=1 Tax=Acidisoma cellulosilyticum TaxID=2802395 RepID=A0A963YZK5_9PROT|nr:helix-turn-helix transcriptional regulator [Acidisoma cellulosilyticum]MCB8879836.1 helix-turn-helix transcriptional regulator [Acidisoma cellulosilyticum]